MERNQINQSSAIKTCCLSECHQGSHGASIAQEVAIHPRLVPASFSTSLQVGGKGAFLCGFLREFEKKIDSNRAS
jgi:hypothetical protein